MVKLTVDNSICKIEGLSIIQHKELREILSYSISASAIYHSGGYGSPKRTLLGKKGDFPSGLLYLVKNYLSTTKIEVSTIDSRRRPPQPQGLLFNANLGCNPYPEQIAAVEACMRYMRGSVTMPTGFGKSITMALLVNSLQVKTLIIVPNLNLKTQLTEAFTKYFGKLDNITIENIDSGKLTKCTNYDCLIIDEAHHVAASTYRKLNKTAWKGIYYRFFFTATPFRSKDEEQLLYESIAGQVIYRVTYQDAVKKGYVVPMEAYYIEIPNTKIKGNPSSWASMYSELVVNNEVRNDIIYDLLLKLHVNNLSTLCLVKEIQHGKNLIYNDIQYFAHGENEDTKHLITLFNRTTLKTLIGTNGVIGEGTDTKPCEYVVIAGLGKSKNSLMQQVGRGFRVYPGKESCKIIIFKDNSHKWTKSHFNTQVKVLKDEYGVIPLKLDI